MPAKIETGEKMKMINTKDIIRKMTKRGLKENIDYRIVHFSNSVELKMIGK